LDFWAGEAMKDKNQIDMNLYFSDSSIGFFREQGKRKKVDIHGNIALEKGILENGYVIDPVLLLTRLKTLFKTSNIHPKRIRLVLNSQNVMMRVTEVKREFVREEGISDYLDAELGKSLHFPFTKPRVSYHLIGQDDQVAKVLAVASDDRLLNDYMDIFDRLGIKKVHFDMPALALYTLYSKTIGLTHRNLMLVTVYDTYFTIKIFEDDIPIFNMIEEFEAETESRYDQIDNYVERIANYYRYNLHHGEKILEKVVFVSQSEQENESRFSAAFANKRTAIPYEVFQIPDAPTAGGGWNRTSLVAYAAGIPKPGNLEKMPWFDFRLDRPDVAHRIIKWMLGTAFFLFAAVSLIYIPYHTMYEEIFIAQNENQNLASQLSALQAEYALRPVFSPAERAYSDAYDTLNAAKAEPSVFIGDLLAISGDSLEVVNYRYRAKESEIVLILVSSSPNALEEFLLNAYETHAVTGIPSPSRWMDGFPVYANLGAQLIEVTFHHA